MTIPSRNGADAESRRVVVTGIGMITPIGHDCPSSWAALLAGRNGGGPITHFEADDRYATRIACEVKDFDPAQHLSKREVRRYDRFAQFALVAAAEAMASAGTDGCPPGVSPERFGVIIGSGIGGVDTFENQVRKLVKSGPRRISPFFVPMFIPNIGSGLVSIRYGAQGPNHSTVSACSSGAHAIGDAYRVIQRGDADVMLTGGAEAAIVPISIAGFSSMKAMSRRNDTPHTASRPFDATRDGFVIGEGAGCLLLESLETAHARDAEILGEVVGCGATADAHHITAPVPGGAGAQNAMRLALKDAGAAPEEVGYINAHGTSTPYNDEIETAAIKAVLGEETARATIVGSTKSMTGHTLGAAGAIESVISVMVLGEGRIPPTTNYQHPDPECDLDYATDGMVEKPVEVALSNSFGFGGHNVCLAFRRWNA